MVGVPYNSGRRFGRKNGLMVEFGWVILMVIGSGVAGCGDERTPTPAIHGTATPIARVLCPTPIPGSAETVPQDSIRPPVPDYPNARDVEVETPGPNVLSLEPNTPTSWSAFRWTRKLTTFRTSDGSQQVLSYYRTELIKAGWWGSDSATPTTDFLRVGFSVESTVSSARWSNPCAPTPETGLPAHGVEVRIVSTDAKGTVVEVKETVDPGY